ncbi:hypothetical protein AVEN_87825-1 [Araneus ventricosus]|uniref:Peptidase aspartic putative domain-containing protein n=1 Tax=Araneus ventricosus TaxID=182803 RepID=A0A4Y2BB13_ARAVE|nr:hypothetical protein AVEN_87825-1 [Araneus ventricosus]
MLLASTRVTEEKKPKCIFCDGKHASSDCFNAQKLTMEEKQKILREKNCCFTCLLPGHSVRKCRIKLKKLNGNFTCNFEVLDQAVICENVLPLSESPWLDELKDLGVILTNNIVYSESMQVLIGADIMGKLLTGKRKLLSSGLVAVETHLGWALMGKVPQVNTERVKLAMIVTSLFVNKTEIADLWRLDVLGIKDPIEKKSKQEINLKTKEHFKETLKFNQDNRYEVCVPWAVDSSLLPDNFNLVKKRLEVTTEKLLSRNWYDKYENVFQEWLDEGIIEEIPPNEVALYGNYVPHRPVIKENSSTSPIRPWKNLEEKKLKVFPHTRVVFGVKSSPFLLASVTEYHIEASKGFDCEFKKILKQSFYVDNVVVSLDSYEVLNNFISKSTPLMLQGGFELRDWESTGCKTEHGWETPVLGMKWNRQLDSLRVNMSWMNELSLEKITKIMLSVARKVFDPIGYTAPVMLCTKLMLQKARKMSIEWDTEITAILERNPYSGFKI